LSGARTDPSTLPPLCADEGGGVPLEFLSEDIIGSNEKPGVIARLHGRFARALGERVGVKGVVNRVGPAVFVCQAHHGRGVHDEDLVALLGDLIHGERSRGARDIEDRFDALLVEPLPGQRTGKVDLVLMVREDDLNRAPKHLAAEVVDCHARGRDSSLAADVGIGPRHVEQKAELQRGLSEGRQRQRGNK
jgi:hypothetical protein